MKRARIRHSPSASFRADGLHFRNQVFTALRNVVGFEQTSLSGRRDGHRIAQDIRDGGAVDEMEAAAGQTSARGAEA